jgi:hypothetical protein
LNSKILIENPEGKRPLENLSKDGMIILKWILGKLDGKMWTGCIWLRIGICCGLL